MTKVHPHMSHLGWKTWNGTHRVLSKSQRLWVAYSPVWPDPTWLSNLISSCSLSRSPHCSSDMPGTALPHCLFWPLTPPESPSSIQMWQFLHFLRSVRYASGTCSTSPCFIFLHCSYHHQTYYRLDYLQGSLFSTTVSVPEEDGVSLLYSLLSPQHLELCRVHGRCSEVFTPGTNKWAVVQTHSLIPLPKCLLRCKLISKNWVSKTREETSQWKDWRKTDIHWETLCTLNLKWLSKWSW